MGLDDVFRRNGDLKGVVPESWLCIDCGTNTAPGWPNRVETEEIVMEARRSRKNVDDIMARKVRATTGRPQRNLHSPQGGMEGGRRGGDGRVPVRRVSREASGSYPQAEGLHRPLLQRKALLGATEKASKVTISGQHGRDK
jgi:hypothetical protein